MEEIINMPVDKLYSKAIEFKQINNYNNYYMYMTMAANYDHPEAINCLTEDYSQDENLLQDHIVTFPFYEQTKNFNYSVNYLAFIYTIGNGVEQNYQKAIELYTQAIEKGNLSSMYNLAAMYHYGNGVEQNYRKAIELYTQAIEKGKHLCSMCNLATMYHHGNGVEQNYQKAIELYTLAIEKGCYSSMNSLAIMYHEGNGVELNYQKAIELYRLAIGKGSTNALENLTCLYRKRKSLFNKKDIIDFFLIKYPNNLKTIFGYNSDMILCLQEKYIMREKIQELEKANKELEKTNKELTDHINLSPGGPEYFEVMNEWKHKSQSDGL